MSITRIRIQNFQSHVDTTILPSSGINVITGRNMSGKSALLRAIRLALFNKPDGNKFVTWGEDNSTIEVEINGNIVRRVKGADNVYELNGSSFQKFGRNIPQEIVDTLGFSPVQVDNESYELNIEGPHDPPFLVSETDTTKGKVLASLGDHLVGDLVSLDKSISVANMKYRKLVTELTVKTQELESLVSMLDSFGPIDAIELDISKCDQLIDEASSLLSDLLALFNKEHTLSRLNSEIDSTTHLLDVYSSLDSVVTLMDDISASSDLLDKLQSYELHYFQIESNLRSIDGFLANLPDISSESVILAHELEVELRDYKSLQAQLLTIISEVKSTDLEMSKIDVDIFSCKSDYSDLFLREKRCPVCLSPISNDIVSLLVGKM